MKFFSTLYRWWSNHGTKILSFVSGTVAAVAGVSGIIPEAHLKYYMGAIAVLTFWRGFTNTANANNPAP